MTRGPHGPSMSRTIALASRAAGILCAAVLGSALVWAPAGATSTRAATKVAGLEVFVRSVHGVAWSARPLRGFPSGMGTPSVASASNGSIVVAERASNGDLVVAEGPVGGVLVPTDLSQSLGVPDAAGHPAIAAAPGAGVSVWYRSVLGHLEVVSQDAVGAAWSAIDVTSSIGGPQLEGDPNVVTSRTAPAVGFAVAQGGSIVAFTAPTLSSPWSESDPTGGLAFEPMQGPLSVFVAPGAPAARVILGTSAYGDVVELSDELGGPRGAVGPWRATDLSYLGVPPASGPITAVGGRVPYASYVTWSGHLIALTLTSGIAGGYMVTDLTSSADASPAPGAVPVVVATPMGEAVAIRQLSGDLVAYPINVTGAASDLSFQPGTAELIASDPAATTLGNTEVIVAVNGGPVAATVLQRRIAIRATSFDQQHREIETTPSGSDCNLFTAAFGRGSTAGCVPGTAAEAWCSDFAQWVWQTSGVPTGGISGWSASFVTWGAAHHRVQLGTHFHAQVGDAIVWGTRSPLYGTHVAIIVAVQGDEIDVVSGNSGGDLPGYGVGVWRSGLFVGSSSTVSGYHVLGVVTP